MDGNGAVTWRPIVPGDAADWAGLLNAISAADRDWEYFSDQDLLEDFSDPYLDFARGSVAVGHEGTMAGYGLLACRTAAEPVHEMRHHGGVHPASGGAGSAAGCSTGRRRRPSRCIRSATRAGRCRCRAHACPITPPRSPCTRRTATSRPAGFTG